MSHRRGEPRFDIDLKWGQEAERKFRKLFRCLVSDDPRVEVKRKSYLDLKFYIETHCDKGRQGIYEPSGIFATHAELMGFLIDDTGFYVFVPTALVISQLDDASSRPVETRDGTCPTRGKLIDFVVLVDRMQKELEQLERNKKRQESQSAAEPDARGSIQQEYAPLRWG